MENIYEKLTSPKLILNTAIGAYLGGAPGAVAGCVSTILNTEDLALIGAYLAGSPGALTLSVLGTDIYAATGGAIGGFLLGGYEGVFLGASIGFLGHVTTETYSETTLMDIM